MASKHPERTEDLTSSFLQRKVAEYEELHAEITALQAKVNAQCAGRSNKAAH